MRIVFMGTPEFSVPCLQALADAGHDIAAVVTQADKPKGRGRKLTFPPVKTRALELGIPVWQPATLKSEEFLEQLRTVAPEVIVVVAFGKLLPRAVLELPRYGCINVHASLLPRYRGAAPIQWAVLNGDAETGVTTMFMDVGLDTGDCLLSAACPIEPELTAGELHDRLSLMGADLLTETLKQLENGTLVRHPQSETTTAYASMLDKSLCPVDFSRTAAQIHNQVRGLNPWPCATVSRADGVLKLYRTRVAESGSGVPGTVIALHPVTVACGGDTALELLEVQAEGGRRMDAAEYFRGHPVILNEKFE